MANMWKKMFSTNRMAHPDRGEVVTQKSVRERLPKLAAVFRFSLFGHTDVSSVGFIK